MCTRRLIVLGCCLAWVSTPGPARGEYVDFEDLPLPPESYYNGADGAAGFVSRGTMFNNHYDPLYQTWSGWAYSNLTDAVTPGFDNQYSSIAGGGADGSSRYGVAFVANPDFGGVIPRIALPEGQSVASARITNTAYDYYSMRDGDDFSKRFGGLSGDDPDFFLLTISGFDGDGLPVGSVDFYLADYRFADNAQDYIVNAWAEVDLSSLEDARTLSFELSSSDVGPFGMNTPAYFALDHLDVVPEPSAVTLLLLGSMSVAGRAKRIVCHCS